MILSHYLVLVAGACALTAAWMFRPNERTQITTLGAFMAWTLVGLLGDDVEVLDENVQEVVETDGGEEIAVQTTGEMVAAPVPDELRLLAGLFALLSGLALILYIWGVYPPRTEGAT